MPTRFLKEAICTSPDIERLTWQEEVFWYRLMVQCDDYGRFHADPSLVRAACFPKRLKRVTELTVARMLQRLAELTMIRLYQVNSRWFLAIPSWPLHQTQRAKNSKFPDPPKHLQADESIGQQPLADASVFGFEFGIRDSYSLGAKASASNGKHGAAQTSPNGSARPPDELFEAIVEVCGWALEGLTRDARGRVNASAKQLRDVMATPEDIQGFAVFWERHYPGMDLTPQAISGNWAAWKGGKLFTKAGRR